ncbi:MAG: class I SAM-dependent methyltransferase [Bacteroidales bacterium]|jgi:SAM-dependent methyltransferase|nr:class I SAM-dependent methyltransferase [Bacteroidales bacterium]
MECCDICGSTKISITYHGSIRTGPGRTERAYDMYCCSDCGTIWHENDIPEQYYESTQYRMELEGSEDIEDFYKRHDWESLDKFSYTGTDIFRNKIVADIGCGGGGWLDFLKGVAGITVAVEPSENYRKHLKEKGHVTYGYMKDVMNDYGGSIDVLTSFDVIEHVADPEDFVNDIFHLVNDTGKVIVGTPTDHPHLRELLGDDFNSFIFSVQHPWVFTERGLLLLFKKAGFQEIQIKKYMKYGLGNVFAWLQEGEPKGHISYPCISPTLNEAWKANLAETGYADYLVVYADGKFKQKEIRNY